MIDKLHMSGCPTYVSILGGCIVSRSVVFCICFALNLPTCRRSEITEPNRLLHYEIEHGNRKLLTSDEVADIYTISGGQAEALGLVERLDLERYDEDGFVVCGIALSSPFYQSRAGRYTKLVGVGRMRSGAWIMYVLNY